MQLTDKIKLRLDQYLEFDSDLIFKCGDPIIFGGAIRDIIADQPIKDVDIIVGPTTFREIVNFLTQEGWFELEGMYPKDISNLYSGIHIISEPKTFIRNNKIIQLIRPTYTSNKKIHPLALPIPYSKEVSEIMYDLISNVDLSPCGIAWNSRNLIECYPEAILHSYLKVFFVNNLAKMYQPNRIEHRKWKLIDRGWEKITSLSEIREVRLKFILEENIDQKLYSDPKIIKYKDTTKENTQENRTGKVWC
jgi:hypothetical protein